MSNFSDVQEWLEKVNCLKYLPQFVDNEITFDLLPELDTPALKELGITKLGDRLRLEFAIADLKAELLRSKISIEDIKRAADHDNDTNNSLEIAEVATAGDSTESGSSSRVVTFILPDGSFKKVNVEGCFNSQLIKRKLLKKLGVKGRDHEYDTYVHTTRFGSVPRVTSLYDVEFVTICFSPDRSEKHRIMLTPKNEQPTLTATEQSLRIMQRMAGRKAPSPQIRNFFGQRPPLELISSNLGQYFPETQLQELEKTIRNSVRHLIRLLRRFNLSNFNVPSARPSVRSSLYSDRKPSGAAAPNGSGRTIGDVFVYNASLLDDAKLGISNEYSPSILSTVSESQNPATLVKSRRRMSVATLFTAHSRNSRIELMSVESDEDDEEGEGEFYEDDDFLAAYDGVSMESSDFSVGRNWLQGARIGAGSFGVVYLGMDPVTGELMAVKQVQLLSGDLGQKDLRKTMVDALHREMSLLKELNHENIVRYLGLSLQGDLLNIFLEYVPGGSVHLMLQLYGPFEEPLIRNFIRQVLVGLSYLHSMDIVHRDIKGANILIDIKGTVKISDFGISKKVADGDDEEESSRSKAAPRRASLQGSVYWMAPEVVKQTSYTKKADIWSVGCLVVEMFTGNHPYPKFSQMQAIFKIGTHTRPELPEWCTDDGKAFLYKTFEFDYMKRPDAVDMLLEPFLTPLVVSDEQ